MEIFLFKEFAAKVERKAAENASFEEDYDDAPDEFKGVNNSLFYNIIMYNTMKRFFFFFWKLKKINPL